MDHGGSTQLLGILPEGCADWHAAAWSGNWAWGGEKQFKEKSRNCRQPDAGVALHDTQGIVAKACNALLLARRRLGATMRGRRSCRQSH